ncbi:MAG: GIY-YIG nuclease family protein [Elusimicrobiota bacterium]
MVVDKKKLRQEYKNIQTVKGVFVIKNNKTGKVLLGSSLNIDGAFNRHRFMLNLGNHRNKELQNEWTEGGGEPSFTFEILETLKQKEDVAYNYDEDLSILELMWIDKYRPFAEKCYNENEKIRTV